MGVRNAAREMIFDNIEWMRVNTSPNSKKNCWHYWIDTIFIPHISSSIKVPRMFKKEENIRL